MGDLRPRLGIVCGMLSEVRALGAFARDPRVAVAVSGARPERAEAEAVRLATSGCGVLLSWGVACGLDPALAPGALLLASAVIEEDSTRHALAPWLAGPAAEGPALILGADRMLLDPAEKSRLRRATGAAAADMETHRVARAAAAAGIPALAIRAVGDPADRAVPALAARALGEDGRPRLGAVALGLLARPGNLADLLRLRRDTASALAALGGIAGAAIAAILTRCSDA